VGPIFLRIRLHWAAINTAAMGTLTVTTKAMAMTVAMQGGMTFHTDMFCKVKTALDVLGLSMSPASAQQSSWAHVRSDAEISRGADRR
jgi:hypothetical protein